MKKIIADSERVKRNSVTIILDAGHGKETPGKRYTFEGVTLYEYQFVRQLSDAIKKQCDALGIKCIQANTDDIDYGLTARANTINKIVRQEAEKGNKCLMISLHANASAKHNATGWEVWSTVGTTNSDKFANILCDVFKKVFPDKRLRGHKEKNFTLIYKCACPCVLTENFFYDYKSDFDFMMTEEGVCKIAELHVQAIKRYIEN